MARGLSSPSPNLLVTVDVAPDLERRRLRRARRLRVKHEYHRRATDNGGAACGCSANPGQRWEWRRALRLRPLAQLGLLVGSKHGQ